MKKILLFFFLLFRAGSLIANSETEPLMLHNKTKSEQAVALIKRYKHPIKAISCLIGTLAHNPLMAGVDGINMYLGSNKVRPSLRAISLFGLMTIPGLIGYKLRQYNVRSPKVRLLTELGRNATIILGAAIITHALLGK